MVNGISGYKLEYFSHDDQCWTECGEDFSSMEAAARSFRQVIEEDPGMSHRILETKTIALHSHGETVTTGGF